MRTLAIVLNIGLLAIPCYFIAKFGMPEGRDLAMALLLVSGPVVNLFALRRTGNDAGWLSLLLKRKALEEQRRIDELKKAS